MYVTTQPTPLEEPIVLTSCICPQSMLSACVLCRIWSLLLAWLMQAAV